MIACLALLLSGCGGEDDPYVPTGNGLTYTWYFQNAGTNAWHKSGVTDNTYDDVMTKARAGRQVYCVVTDAWGHSVTTDTVTLVCN